VAPQSSRKALVKGSKQTSRRYKNSGLRVKAGAGAGTMIVAGTAVAVVGVSAAYAGASAALASGAATAGGTAAAAGGLMLFAPVLLVGGVMRSMNNSAVDEEIAMRHTALPVEIAKQQQAKLTVFFPFAPSPRYVELQYTDDNGEHVITINTKDSLDGLHINGS
jgi:hypothetical protein